MFGPVGPPPMNPSSGRIFSFNTAMLWGLCFVVLGVCYKLEERDNAARKPSVLLLDEAGLAVADATAAPPK